VTLCPDHEDHGLITYSTRVLSGPFCEIPPVGSRTTNGGHINKPFQRYLESALSFSLVDYIPKQVLEKNVEQVKSGGISLSTGYILRSIVTGGRQPTRADFVPIASDTSGQADNDGLTSFSVPFCKLLETCYQRLHESCSTNTTSDFSRVARRMTYYFDKSFVHHTVQKGGRLGYIAHSVDLELPEEEAEAMVANWQQSLMHRQIEETCDAVTDDATPEDIQQLEASANAEFNRSVADWCCKYAGMYGPIDSMDEDDPDDSIE
jgi:hypothetical protein